MGYGRRHLKRSGKVAGEALVRRRVRRARKAAVIAVLAGVDLATGGDRDRRTPADPGGDERADGR